MSKHMKDGDFMKHLPQELKQEYDYFAKNNPDIEGISHPLINISDTFKAYFILVHYFTDASSKDTPETMLVGIRSVDLLASAIGRQVTSYGGKVKYQAPLDICATLFFGMVKNHSFSDGNKRTALLILLYQLHLYGFMPTASKKEFEKLVLAVAEDSIAVTYRSSYRKFKKLDDAVIRTISYQLSKMTAKKDNTYHVSPTMREFCVALENQGVTCTLENNKIKMTYKPRRKWYCFETKEMHSYIPFGGWTRTVGAKTARDALEKLELYDQFPSYNDLLDDGEQLYDLVDNFKEPLRRLKDK